MSTNWLSTSATTVAMHADTAVYMIWEKYDANSGTMLSVLSMCSPSITDEGSTPSKAASESQRERSKHEGTVQQRAEQLEHEFAAWWCTDSCEARQLCGYYSCWSDGLDLTVRRSCLSLTTFMHDLERPDDNFVNKRFTTARQRREQQ